MDIVLRFILRLFLVPLGAVVAMLAGMLVLVAAHWSALEALARASPDAQEEWFIAFVIAGPVLALFLSMMTMLAFTAASIGVLISEAFAIRSWIFHAANGAAAAWIGWSLMNDARSDYPVFTDPTKLVAAGLVGGLAYWLIAGWSAGFWKPMTRQSVAATPAKSA
jgi:hypothetical protein